MERKRDSFLFLLSFSLSLSFLGLLFQAAFDHPPPAAPAPSLAPAVGRTQKSDNGKASPFLSPSRAPLPRTPYADPTEQLGGKGDIAREEALGRWEEKRAPGEGWASLARPELTPGSDPLPASRGEKENASKGVAKESPERAQGVASARRVNRPPVVARPGEDLRTLPGQPVILDGKAFSQVGEPGRPAYRWRLLERPSGSVAEISDPQGGPTLLVPDRPGLYAVELRPQEDEPPAEAHEKELPAFIVLVVEETPVVMPAVTGLALEEARLRLEEAGIGLEWVSARAEPGTPDGQVLAQDPQAGAVLAVTVQARLVIALSTQTDSDADGLADLWEYAMFGSLKEDAAGDRDGDGFDNLQEFRSGTHPDDRREAPVAAANLFEYDRYGRLVFQQIVLEP